MEPRLQDMPYLVKNQIVAHMASYCDQMSLKTACSNFLPIIGNPYFECGKLCLTFGAAIELRFESESIKDPWKSRCRVVEGSTDMVISDFDMLIASNPNFIIGSFEVMIEQPSRVLSEIQSTLKGAQLKVKRFSIRYNGDQSEALQLLPYLDSDNLELLELDRTSNSTQEVKLNEIVKLKQWRNVKSLKIRGFPDELIPKEIWWNYPETEIQLEEAKLEDLQKLFQHFRKLQNFQKSKILTTLKDRQIAEALGGEFSRMDGYQWAYFSKTKSEIGIHVYIRDGDVEFSRRAHGWMEGDTDYYEMYGLID